MSWPPYNQLLIGSTIPVVKRKCFISYHHADQVEVNAFIRKFDHKGDIFTARGLGTEMSSDIIDSINTDYVMRRIRELYLKGSSVTIIMIGHCTWSRRYVDWEIQASLRTGVNIQPNGLLAIKLPNILDVQFPYRLNDNLIKENSAQIDCYARWMSYPLSEKSLYDEIEAAYLRRQTHKFLIQNSRSRMINNRPCANVSSRIRFL